MRILMRIVNAMYRLVELYLIDEYNIDTVSTNDSTKHTTNKRQNNIL